MSKLRDAMRLFGLKGLADGSKGIHTNQLETDFLAFSSFVPKKALTVKVPKLYSLGGDEKGHISEILADFHEHELPDRIDISGAFDYFSTDDRIILLSLQQLRADHFFSTRSYLNPLIEEVYVKGESLIRDFAIHEGLSGKIVCKRGNLDLREAHLFPERFASGPYELFVVLDTSAGTVERFVGVTELLKEFYLNPKNSVLDPDKIEHLTNKAVDLRKKLGSLSRYDMPDTRSFSAKTNSCVIRNKDSTLFYLYSPNKNKNLLVYFGINPFAEREPQELAVLNGNEHQKTLVELVNLGLYDASSSILKKRVNDLNELYETAIRAGSDSNHIEFKGLLNDLAKSQKYFEMVLNSDIRRRHVANLNPELVEFMVYPSAEDPIVHELFPRLSWNESLRRYHSTRAFIKEFEDADDGIKKEMLHEVTSNILFNNQQNNNVNSWLYQNHHDFCTEAGVEFSVLK